FARLARFGNEPRVLHRDDRLRGEVLQQRELLVAERPDFLPVDMNRAEQNTVFPEGHYQQCANIAKLYQSADDLVAGGAAGYIRDLDEVFAESQFAERGIRGSLPPPGSNELNVTWRNTA